MILSYAKSVREQLVKAWEKKKKYMCAFSTLSVDDMKTKKKHKSVALV